MSENNDTGSSVSEAPPGWYPAGNTSGMLRYFDGRQWTDHYHIDGELPEIKAWANTSFTAISRGWKELGAVSLCRALFLGTVMLWAVWYGLGDFGVRIEPDSAELLRIPSAGRVFTVATIGIVCLVAFLWFSLALRRMSQQLHYGHGPNLTSSLRHALNRLPLALGLIIAILALVTVLAAVAAVILVAAAAQASLAILVFLVLLPCVLALSVWGYVKLIFVLDAVVAGPSGNNAVRSSMNVSSGRFWAVAGRLLLLSIAGWVTNFAVQSSAGAVGGTQWVTIDENETEFLFRELIPDLQSAGASFVIFMLLASVVQACWNVVAVSAGMRLYLDGGGPSDIQAEGQANLG